MEKIYASILLQSRLRLLIRAKFIFNISMFSLNGFPSLCYEYLFQVLSFCKETLNGLLADSAFDPPEFQIVDQFFGSHILAALGSCIKLHKGLHLVRPHPQLITFPFRKSLLLPETDFLLLAFRTLHRPLKCRQIAGVILHRQILNHICHIDGFSVPCRRKQLK